MSRLSIEIEPDQHRQIKTLATFAGMSIKEFILTKTLSPKDTTDRLLADPKNAKRLRDALVEEQKEEFVFETVDDLKDALGI